MFSKIIVAVFACIAVANCGVVPAAYISPYASTYNAHAINHAVATPFIGAPAAKLIASPFAPAARVVSSPYISSPYVSSPYVSSPYISSAYSPYSSPLAYSPYSAYPSNYYF